MQKVRVRFAPSPTGFLNLGGVRSALFNWLFARHHQGHFFLRLEDTDRTRYVPESAKQIAESLDWLGIIPDEKPLVQSERLEIYSKKATELQDKGWLYPCWCSSERLEKLRSEAQAKKIAFKYDRHCLNQPGDKSTPHVLRFKVPAAPKEISWDDAVKGMVAVPIETIDDFVALKSDGFPTYHFANVVDDHLTETSHVLRADEWLSSTPKHLLLYQAFTWEPPVFAHLPAVLGADGSKKLSKRHGAKSVLEYRDEGFLPEAVINFVAMLGWNEGEGSTKEIYTGEELVKAFSLNRVQKSPAVFDAERLTWMNGLYIRGMDIDELAKRAEMFWPKSAAKYDEAYKKEVLKLEQERLKFLAELPELTDFFFEDPQIAKEAFSKWPKAAELLDEATNCVKTWEDLESRFRASSEKLGVKPGDLFMVTRIAITGSTVSPGLFETMKVLGKETTLRRLEAARKLG